MGNWGRGNEEVGMEGLECGWEGNSMQGGRVHDGVAVCACALT